MAVSAEHVLYLAAGIFGAAPTRALTYDLMTRKDTVALANELGVSQYAKDVFGVSNQAKAEKLADNLLGTSVTDAVKTAATGALKGMLDANGGNVGAAGYEAIIFLSKTADANYTPAWTQLQNRVAAAQAYVDSANPATTFPLTSVTQDTATRDAVIAAIKSGADTAPLTVNSDLLVANKFSAGLDYTPGGNDRVNTLQDEDVLTGVGVNPTLNATLGNANDNGGTTIHPTLRGVETINVAFSGTNGATGAVNVLDLQDSTGIKSANITRVSQVNGDVSLDNLTAVTESLSLNNTSVNTNSVEFSFVASAVSGAQDSTKITLNNANTRNLVIEQNTTAGNAANIANTALPTEGFETINMVSSGSANTVGQLWAEDLQTLNISGDQNLTIGATTATVNAGTTVVEASRYNDGFGHVNGSLTAVNAAELTGNLDVTFGGELNAIKDNTSGVNMAVTVTGGKGNDVVRLNNDTVGTTDLIDGGEGNNTLVLVSNAVVNAAGTAAAPVATVKNVQSLEVRTGHDLLAVADVVTVNADAFDKLEKIFVRNEGQIQVGAAWNPAAEGMTATLNNLTSAQANAITLAHGTTGNSTIANNALNIGLKTATGVADTAQVTIVDGVNSNPVFNANISTLSVERVTLVDSDTESNTVHLNQGTRANPGATPTAGQYAQTGSSITLNGGAAGQYISLDSFNADVVANVADTVANDYVAQAGYGYATDGTTQSNTTLLDRESAQLVAGGGANAAIRDAAAASVFYGVDTVLPVGGVVTRHEVENIVADTYAGDIVVRLGDVTRADGVSSMDIKTGAGNDTLIFDAQNVANAGFTSGDSIVAGAGTDTLVIDGNLAARIDHQASEWDNLKGIDVLRFGDNTGVANVGNNVRVANAGGAYYARIDNAFISQTDAGNRLTVINNDGDLALNSESDLVLDLRGLSEDKWVTFVGANGVGNVAISSNRIVVDDNSANRNMILNGGDTDFRSNDNTGNNNVLEVRNEANVSINDLSQVRNFGLIEFTNAEAVAQTLTLTLNNTVVDNLVDSNHVAAATAGNFETLFVQATALAGGNAQLNVNATAVTSAALQLNVTGGAGADTIVGGAGADTITGGAGADTITTGTGADRVTYTAAGQGGNTTTVASATAMTAGDVITDFATTVDDIVVTAAINGTGAAAAAGAANAWNLNTNGAFVLTGAVLDFVAGVTTAANVAAVIGTVTGDVGDRAYIAILDDQGDGAGANDTYQIYEVTLANARAGAAIATTDTISLVATVNSTAFVAGDFIV